MNGSYALDTNIVIALFADDSVVTKRAAGISNIFIPSIVIGELYYGARKSSRATENLARIDEFVESNVVLSCDTETARQYGEIKDRLRQKGRPIPENDIWVAAAFQHGLSVATRDAHFSEIDGLVVETW